MPLADVNSTLGQRTLTEAVRTLDTGDTDTMFQDLFAEGRETLKPDGEKAEYFEIQHSRALAAVSGIENPMPIGRSTSLVDRDTAMFRIAQKRFIPWRRLFLQSYPGDPMLKANAPSVIRDELRDMKLEVTKTKEYCFAKVLLNGGLTVNDTNVPGSDIQFPLDFGVKTANRAAAWSTAGTAIISDEIPKFQEAMVGNCGKPIRRAIINDKTVRYILANTEVTSYGKNWEMAQRFLRANTLGDKILDGLEIGGLDWTVNGFGYKPDGGSFTRWMSDDHAIFLPESLEDVLQIAEGLQPVPVDSIAALDGETLEEFPDLQRGLVAYAVWEKEPVGLWIHVAWYGTPLVLQPDAVIDATLV